MLQEKLKALMILGIKAKTLMKVDVSTEPRIVFKIEPDLTTSIVFYSSCFPFFNKHKSITFSENEIDNIITQCALFVSDLEQGRSNLSEIARKAVEDSKNVTLVYLNVGGKHMCYALKVCRLHQKHPTWYTKPYALKNPCRCRCVLIDFKEKEPAYKEISLWTDYENKVAQKVTHDKAVFHKMKREEKEKQQDE